MARGRRTVDRLRAGLLTRARGERLPAAEPADEAPAAPSPVEMQAQGPRPAPAPSLLPPLDTLLPPVGRGVDDESPKSPDADARPPAMARPPAGHHAEPHHAPQPLASPSSATSFLLPAGQPDAPRPPERAATPRPREPTPPIHMTAALGGADAALGTGRPAGGDERRVRPRPKRFLLCLPWVQSRRIRSQVLTSFLSGTFCLSLLAVYLGLTLTNMLRQSEVAILIVLIILTSAVFFCYSTVRLCLLIFRPDREARRRAARVPDMAGQGSYVVPVKPIPVVLARDEEAVGIESTTAKARPPAYGLWRESIRVDPNRLFWQRTKGADIHRATAELQTGPRPPSYASEDGVAYVVEARPRSVAPPPDSVYAAAAAQPALYR